MSEPVISEIGVQLPKVHNAYRKQPSFGKKLYASNIIESSLASSWPADGAADRFGLFVSFVAGLQVSIQKLPWSSRVSQSLDGRKTCITSS